MKRLIVCLLSVLWFLPGNASHIIGGDISVQWIAADSFEIQMKVFRDCSDGNNAEIDDNVTVFVRDWGNDNIVKELTMGVESVKKIPLGGECFTPESICLEQGIYDTTVTLADNPPGYYVGWERCCRNNIIENIQNPGEEGMVFFARIADPAKQNSTPSFGDYPKKGYFCIDDTNERELKVSEPDGDSLVYSLETPWAGDRSGNGGGIINPGPKPGGIGTPPFTEVGWTGPYNANNMITGNPPLSIDPQSGTLTIAPDVSGVFVFAIRVEEYRNGELLSVVRREVQYEVLEFCGKNFPPQFASPVRDTFNIVPGQDLCFDVEVTDQNTDDSLKLIGESELFGSGVESPRAEFRDTLGDGGAIASRFCWETRCRHIQAEEPYQVKFTAWDSSCSGSDTVVKDIDIRVGRPPQDILDRTPNVFTPNGDDKNEKFIIPDVELDPCYDSFEVQVYNRWGKLLFEDNTVYFEWDGTDQMGNDVPEGVYFYTIKASFRDRVFKKNGGVQVIR